MSAKKQTTNSSSTSNTSSTTTPNVPDWISAPAQAAAGNVSGLISQGPAAYTPGISDLQNTAATNASNLTTSPYYGQAADTLNNAPSVSASNITPSSLLTNLSSYYNPFESQITDPVLQAYDQQAGQTTAAQAAAAAKNQAFQGSRYGIQEAQTAGQLALGRAQTQGTLLNQMFNTSTGLSNEDAARAQQAATSNQSADLAASEANASNALQKGQILAGLGTASGAQALSNTALQGQLGTQQTASENAAKQYPLTYDAQTEALLQGLNPGLFTGQSQVGTGQSTGTQTQTTNPGLLDYLGTAAQIGGLFANPLGAAGALGSSAASGTLGTFMCDRRLKRDVVKIGMRADGLALYAFRYLWDKAVRVGVMAQEVLRVKPQAVVRHPLGFLMVNTEAL